MQQSPAPTRRFLILSGRWSFAAWLPFAIASCATAAYVFLAVDDGFPMGRGPGGGGEGIVFLIVWFLRLIAFVALVACYFFRPRGKAWNAKAVVISTMLWGLIFAGPAVIYAKMSSVTVHVRAEDKTGRPLSGVKIDYRWAKRKPLIGFTVGRGTAVANASGIATFRVPAFYTLDISGDKKLRPTHEVNISRQGGPTLHISHSKDGFGDLKSYRATAPDTSELNVSIEFEPPTNR